jgi:prophage antirepressor-like protein
MTALTLSAIATDFHGTAVNILDHAGRKWLTAEEVGLCLGYAEANAGAGIRNLYNRHLDRFDEGDACRINLMRRDGLGQRLLAQTTA